MTPQLIREQLSGTGPDLIRTSDGKQYPVPHTDFLMVGRYNVVVEKPDVMLDIIDPIRIVSIRPSRKRRSKS